MARSRRSRVVEAKEKAARLRRLRHAIHHWHRPVMQILEQRLLLTQDVWTGQGDGTTWTNPSNWSTLAVPGASDDAVINVAAGVTIDYNGNSSIESITDDAALEITGGTFTVTSGTSLVSGTLTVSAGATLSASGPGTTFAASGAATVDGANLYISGGAMMSMTGATTYDYGAGGGATIQADEGEIDLSGVTTLEGASSYGNVAVNAYDGGEVDLSGVTSQPSGRISFYADGTGSTIDLSKLPELLSDANYNSSLEAESGGAILTPALSTLDEANVQLDDNASAINTSQITAITSSNLYAYGGGDLAFPALTQIVEPNGNTLEASGTGSVLDLTSLTALTGSSAYSTLPSMLSLVARSI